MECDREEESGEMYSPNESGEYTPCGDTPNFTVQGLQDALNEAESTVTEPQSLAEEFIIQLEVTMADRPGRPQPPAYSWNGGLVWHALKNDPAMGDLKHVEVDGPGWACLFFMTDMDIARPPQRRGSGHEFPHCRCVYRVDLEIRTLQRGSSIARSRTTMRGSHAREVPAAG